MGELDNELKTLNKPTSSSAQVESKNSKGKNPKKKKSEELNHKSSNLIDQKHQISSKIEDLNPLIQFLNRLGIHGGVGNYFIGIGVLTIFVAGWFFASFWAEKGVTAPNFLSSVVSFSFNFLEQLFQGNNEAWNESLGLIQLGMGLLVLFLFIGIVSILIWVIERFLKSLLPYAQDFRKRVGLKNGKTNDIERAIKLPNPRNDTLF